MNNKPGIESKLKLVKSVYKQFSELRGQLKK